MGTDIQRRFGPSRGNVPKVLGGVAVHVWLQQRPLTLSLSRQVPWSELHLESVLRQPCRSVILGYSGTVSRRETGRTGPSPSAGGIGQIPETLQSRTVPSHKLDITPSLKVLKTKYWLSLQLCCLRNAKFVKFSDTHDYSICIICCCSNGDRGVSLKQTEVESTMDI